MAAALADALRGLERVIVESRAHWNDSARQAFDQRHGDLILSEGKRTNQETQKLAQEIASAVQILDGIR